jgi:hypothetical protein
MALSSQVAEKAVHVLLEDLIDFGRECISGPQRSRLKGIASVQEIVLIALSISLSQVEYDGEQVIDIIRQVQLNAGTYIKKVNRCVCNFRSH